MIDNKKIPTWLGVVIIVIFAITVGVMVWRYEKEASVAQIKNSNNQSEKITNNLKQLEVIGLEIKTPIDGIYKNTRYNFQITIPTDWKIIESNNNQPDPVFVFYKEIQNTIDDKIISASLFTKGTFVIVRPYGQSSSGLSGKKLPSAIKSSEKIKIASDYILRNQSRWATFVSFKNNPESWNESGFIFGRNIIQNEKETCERNGIAVDENKCDLWNGDIIAYDGYINKSDRKQIEQIISSFKFIP